MVSVKCRISNCHGSVIIDLVDLAVVINRSALSASSIVCECRLDNRDGICIFQTGIKTVPDGAAIFYGLVTGKSGIGDTQPGA